MKFEELFIGILIFTLVVTTSVLWMADLNSRYGKYGVSFDTTPYTGNYSKTEEIASLAGIGDSQVAGEATGDDAQPSMIRGAYGVLKLVTNSYQMVNNILGSISAYLGVPEVFINTALAALIITVVFSIAYLLLGKVYS
jgi:hypothetical protein